MFQIPKLARVTGQIVADDVLLWKSIHDGQQDVPGFMGALQFVQCIRLVNESKRDVRSSLGNGSGDFHRVFPLLSLGVDLKTHFQHTGMVTHFWCDLLQLLGGLDAVPQLEPTLSSFQVALIVKFKRV
ncbi:MAG: hypothetical protein WCT12_25905, partial [Verrucomicrobiota bacterium]